MMKPFERLEDELHRSCHVVWSEEVEHLLRDLVSREGLVDVLDVVLHLFGRQGLLLHAFQIDVV